MRLIEREWRNCAEQGMTAKEAAAYMGVRHNSAHLASRRYGITFKAASDATIDRLRECAEKGMTKREAAKSIGISYTHICALSVRESIPFNRAINANTDPKRNAAIVAAHLSGETLQDIGDRYGLTRERVRQIVERAGTKSARAMHAERVAAAAAEIGQGKLTREDAMAIARRHRVGLAACMKAGASLIHVFDRHERSAEIAAAIERVKAGMSIWQSCDQDRSLQSVVRYRLKCMGIKSSLPRGRPRKDKPKPDPIVIDSSAYASVRDVAIAYRGKATASQLAEACGTTRNAIIGHWYRSRQQEGA